MNFLSFEDFLNESAESISGKMFVKEFTDEVNSFIPKLTNGLQDVWCMPKPLFDAFKPENRDLNLRMEAERFEETQRKMSERDRLATPYFLIEYTLDLQTIGGNYMHVYRVLGIDMENKEMFLAQTSEIESVKDELEKIFDRLLKKYYPTLHTSRKYGL